MSDRVYLRIGFQAQGAKDLYHKIAEELKRSKFFDS